MQSTFTVTICCLSLTGMVFAKDISTKIYNKYFTGKGVETAINEGYVANTEMEEQGSNSTIQNEKTGEIIEDNETTVKVSELIMDDFTLSMTFEVTLSDKVKDIIKAQDVMEMYFSDIVVYFDLTTYDATDEITLHLEYKGDKADIVLEKVEQK